MRLGLLVARERPLRRLGAALLAVAGLVGDAASHPSTSACSEEPGTSAQQCPSVSEIAAQSERNSEVRNADDAGLRPSEPVQNGNPGSSGGTAPDAEALIDGLPLEQLLQLLQQNTSNLPLHEESILTHLKNCEESRLWLMRDMIATDTVAQPDMLLNYLPQYEMQLQKQAELIGDVIAKKMTYALENSAASLDTNSPALQDFANLCKQARESTETAIELQTLCTMQLLMFLHDNMSWKYRYLTAPYDKETYQRLQMLREAMEYKRAILQKHADTDFFRVFNECVSGVNDVYLERNSKLEEDYRTRLDRNFEELQETAVKAAVADALKEDPSCDADTTDSASRSEAQFANKMDAHAKNISPLLAEPAQTAESATPAKTDESWVLC